MQSAQPISAAYYRNLAARDYTLAAGAIELVVEGVPCSALIEPSQSCEFIFCDRSDRLRGRKHAGDGGKLCRDLQEQSGPGDRRRERDSPRSVHLPLETWRWEERTVGLLRKVYAKRAKIRGEQQATPAPTWARFQDWPSGDNEYFD